MNTEKKSTWRKKRNRISKIFLEKHKTLGIKETAKAQKDPLVVFNQRGKPLVK